MQARERLSRSESGTSAGSETVPCLRCYRALPSSAQAVNRKIVAMHGAIITTPMNTGTKMRRGVPAGCSTSNSGHTSHSQASAS